MQLNKLPIILNVFFKLLVLSIFIIPFLWMISTALQTFEESMSIPLTLFPETPQWRNFSEAFQSGPFGQYTKNSIIVTSSIIIIQFIIMIPAAYAFAKYEFIGKNLFFMMVLVAFMIPGQITFIPIYLMMGKWGLINSLWPQILPFAANAFGIFLLRQTFKQVPDEIIEAARLDYSNEWKIMKSIMLPLSIPVLATIGLFSFVSHWNDYFWPLVMTNSDEWRTLPIGISMLKETEGISNWHIIMAGNVMLVAPILLIYFFCSRYIVRAFTYSGIK